MNEPHHRRRGRRGSASVGVVLAICGLLFTANARLARTSEVRGADNLGGLVEEETRRLEQQGAEVDALRARVEVLTSQQNTIGPTPDPEQQALVEFTAGLVAATGPGMTVKLSDAVPAPGQRMDVQGDDLVVHQQDVQAVVDALWAGGAEAMSIQGQRVISTTAVQCIGSVLFLQGIRYSPPYVISAIGDPASLQRSLADSPGVEAYLAYVDSVGLGWSVTKESALDIPAGNLHELQFATVPDGVEAIPGPEWAASPTPTASQPVTVTESAGKAGSSGVVPDADPTPTAASPSPSR